MRRHRNNFLNVAMIRNHGVGEYIVRNIINGHRENLKILPKPKEARETQDVLMECINILMIF